MNNDTLSNVTDVTLPLSQSVQCERFIRVQSPFKLWCFIVFSGVSLPSALLMCVQSILMPGYSRSFGCSWNKSCIHIRNWWWKSDHPEKKFVSNFSFNKFVFNLLIPCIVQDYYDEGIRTAESITNRIYGLKWSVWSDNLPVFLKVLFRLYDDRSEKVMIAFGGENVIIRIVNASTGKKSFKLRSRFKFTIF